MWFSTCLFLGFSVFCRLQSFTGCLGQALVFVWGSALRGGFNFCFPGDFYRCWRNSHFWGGAWRRAMAVWSFEVFLIFPNFPRSSLLGRSATGIYQFITNNDASFHLWWKENLLNYQKVSKYYEYTCRFVWCFFVSVKTGFILIIS